MWGIVEWEHLVRRFEEKTLDSGRTIIWEASWRAVRDVPVFGTGPGTFSAVYQLYMPVDELWQAYAHQDWLEALVTFGAVGTMILLAGLGLLLAGPKWGQGILWPRFFLWMLYLSLGSCLVFACVDFPFQIYSIKFVVVIVCALLAGSARPHTKV